MKEWAKDPGIRVMNEDGKSELTTMSYKKSSVPGTVVLFTAKYYDNKVQLAMTQDELNKAVRAMEIYIGGKQITEAPIGTLDHDFWKSEFAYHRIEKGETKLDDSDPKERYVLAAMRKDKEFYFKEAGSPPPSKSMVKWTVIPLDAKSTQIVEEEGDSIQAVKQLSTMDYDKQISILKIYGKKVDGKTDPKIVEAMLFRIITSEKDEMFSDGITNLQKFLSLSLGSNADININAIANDAKIYMEKRNGMYYYGEIKLGKNNEEIVEFLKNDNDLLHELKRKTDKK